MYFIKINDKRKRTMKNTWQLTKYPVLSYAELFLEDVYLLWLNALRTKFYYYTFFIYRKTERYDQHIFYSILLISPIPQRVEASHKRLHDHGNSI